MKKAKAISSISKKIQIGILEYHCHVPDLFTLCKICKTSKTNVTVFTKKNIWNGVLKYLDNAGEYNVIFQDDIKGDGFTVIGNSSIIFAEKLPVPVPGADSKAALWYATDGIISCRIGYGRVCPAENRGQALQSHRHIRRTRAVRHEDPAAHRTKTE